MATQIQTYAPGKVILLGEHAVVAGEPALVGSISRGVRVVADEAAKFSLAYPEGITADGRRLFEKAFEVAARGVGCPPLRFHIESQLPVSMGLGSSAATAVACARALLEASGLKPTLAKILELAMRMERVFHGTPSGVDHTCSAYSRLLLFSRTDEPERPSVKLLPPSVSVPVVVALVGKRGLTRSASRPRESFWKKRFAWLAPELKSADELAFTRRA